MHQVRELGDRRLVVAVQPVLGDGPHAVLVHGPRQQRVPGEVHAARDQVHVQSTHPVDVRGEVDRRRRDRCVLVHDRNVEAVHLVGDALAALLGAAHLVGEDPDRLGVQLLGQVGRLGARSCEGDVRALRAEQAGAVRPVCADGVAERRDVVCLQEARSREARGGHADDREDVILLDQGAYLVGVLRGVRAVVEWVSELDRAPGDASLGVDHRQIRPDAVEDRGEVGRDRTREGGDASDDDLRAADSLGVAGVGHRRLGVPAPCRDDDHGRHGGHQRRPPTRSPSRPHFDIVPQRPAYPAAGRRTMKG